ncbi:MULTISPECIES: acyl-CoA synthetase [Acinetobacter]|jgi:fatty-acyl-CoA synthase|uniref:acyl-CoA synthetase n=1 Tax=Acinetobacter TaxID=469 RepID=UPI0010408D1E|nr:MULTISPECIES: acyl-CoA synthetase [Acinetobacter]MCA4779561.1 acyl-CoA synthetase [Acinetobacter towneri]MCA4784974.1 acyl-CoA synthetase [Acinetobacter towneri]MCA4786476.1 acyl-CoA synthetase [Acinetobacter towneri]MCA4790121.1 acyl-CoA synthetase [Acinetobacter towneri]MCA4796132.1 acyl-CoA synthetase [Acinetobacter towneri]
MVSAYDELPRTPANFVALSPLRYLERAAYIYPHQNAIIHGSRQITWRETYLRCCQFAHQLQNLGISKNDTVSVLLPNVPAMLEAHFAVPMAGAVLNTLNTRLDAKTLAFMLDHAESKVLLVDPEFAALAQEALAMVNHEIYVIDVNDAEYEHAANALSIGQIEYETWLAAGDPNFEWHLPQDEWDAISLNYTSGTTGNPKGVVYHHRGAYINAASNIIACGMTPRATYLWTLPLFHCNGWCFAWTMAANGGTNICLRKVDPELIFKLIAEHKVDYFCGAPIVLSMLINTPEEKKTQFDHRVEVMVAGAAPPAAIIEGMRNIGINVTHVYGLTETYGPSALCASQAGWSDLSIQEQAQLHSRQGVPYPLQDGMKVLDPETMQPVPKDGKTMGEIMFRGNIVMKGYLKNPEATAEAFAGGWFHTGDLAVCQPDGYAKITDRSKDVIISGGENISSLEVEEVLYQHPAILTAAVVAKPDPRWQEVPCAFIELKEGKQVSPEEIIAYCSQHLARFKVPKDVVITEIPKTSTGKLQKFVLREWAKERSVGEFG